MKKDLIKELQADRNLYAECECGVSFPLHKALMFYADGPMPEEVKKLILESQAEIKARRKQLIEDRKKLKKRSYKGTVAIGLGKILEKTAAAVRGFKYNPRDCRFLAEPIDYLIFDGLTRTNGIVDSIHFVDIKTGKSDLNKNQKKIKKAVEEGKVAWDEYKGKL